jgi:hypothetical protein
MLLGDKLQEALWTDTDPIGEQPLEMIFTHMAVCSNLTQTWLARGVLFYVVYDLLDASIVIGELGVIDHGTIIRKGRILSTRILLDIWNYKLYLYESVLVDVILYIMPGYHVLVILIRLDN